MSTYNMLLWTIKKQYPYLLVEKSVPSGAMHKQSILEYAHLNSGQIQQMTFLFC